MKSKIRYIAFNLPQFHPIPENNDWWGEGFTEWTNAAKAKPKFRGHYQPHVPADLGFYDLRLPEAREAQAALAKEYGIEAFCYYHYWFGGKRLLDRPFNEIISSKRPDFPFCVCWANQTWTGIWHGAPNRILIEQTYPGLEDHLDHFQTLLPAFLDERYLRINDKPLFLIYRPWQIPKIKNVVDFWRSNAEKAGLGGLYLIAVDRPQEWDDVGNLFDAYVIPKFPPRWVSKANLFTWLLFNYRKYRGLPVIYNYKDVIKLMLESDAPETIIQYPCVIPNWDNTPRSNSNGLVLHDSRPEYFKEHLRYAINLVDSPKFEHKIIFIKSWNEWAEGNHMEPDLRFGRKYLEVLQELSI